MTDQELRLLARGPKYDESGRMLPFIESLRRDFDTRRLYGYGRSSGGSMACLIPEPMSDCFMKLTEGLEIPPVLAKVDL